MKRWTKEEIRFLKENYKKLDDRFISKTLKRSIDSIKWKRNELSLLRKRWHSGNRLTKNKVIKLLLKHKRKIGKNLSINNTSIAIKSACQRHFGSFNNAKKAAKLEIKENFRSLQPEAYQSTPELAYITGLLLGDGSLRFQKSKERKSYVITFTTKDKELMDYFLEKFSKWSDFKAKTYIVKGGYKRFPSGKESHYKKTYNTQISFKRAWIILKKFFDKPLMCLEFFKENHLHWIIKGLWDAEGCANVYDNRIRFYFSNKSDEIVTLYKKLLDKRRISYRVDKSKQGMYNITISNKFDVLKFFRTIKGITIKRKETQEIKKIVNKLKKEQHRVNFSLSFKDQVYEITKKIPIGYVSTYAEVARMLKNPNAYRAVGNTLNKNPHKDVPCHRVIASNGHLGGFARGLEKKIKLLNKEGVEVIDNKVNLEKYYYKLI